jgi:hypothetical protein
MKRTEKILNEIEKLRNERFLLETRLISLEEDLVKSVEETETLWTRDQAARYLGISTKHLDDMRTAGKILSRNISGAIRFDPEAVKNYGTPESGPADPMPRGRPKRTA